jgi:hypothetical protein
MDNSPFSPFRPSRPNWVREFLHLLILPMFFSVHSLLFLSDDTSLYQEKHVRALFTLGSTCNACGIGELII